MSAEAPPEFDDPAIPTVDSEPVPQCNVCKSSEARPVAHGWDYELRTCRNQWTFVRCEGCGHVRLNPRPTAEMLPVIYPETYYSYDMEASVKPIALKGKAMLDARKFRGIVRYLDRKPRSYLDVGCGDGKYLRVMERQGISRDRLVGLELSEEVAQRLSAEGYRVLCERAETCDSIPPGSIDLATMFHVIEHVADPAGLVAKVADWLAPGGVFALETPNVDSLDARLFRDGYWGGYHIPRHWHLFDASNLRRLLEDHGFEVVGTRYQTGHSFWMYSFHHLLRYNRRRPMKGAARQFDPLLGLPMLAAFTGFDIVRATLGLRTSAILMIARKPGP